MDANWLVNLVARARGFSGAKFSGDFASEFDYLAKKEIKLIDFNQHIDSIKVQNKRAISRTRYGYDDEGDEDDFLNLPDIGF